MFTEVFSKTVFSYLWDRVISIFSGAGKFWLGHGLRQVTRDTKIGVSCLQTILIRRNEELQNDVRSWSSFNVSCKKFKEIIRFYSIIGKKNNQPLVSGADRVQSQHLVQRLCRKRGKHRFRHYPFTLGLGFLCLHQRPMIYSI